MRYFSPSENCHRSSAAPSDGLGKKGSEGVNSPWSQAKRGRVVGLGGNDGTGDYRRVVSALDVDGLD